MPRNDDVRRLRDILDAIDKIQQFASADPEWPGARGGLVLDAILYNLAIIGEAVKAISEETRALAPDADWTPAARMRDVLIHRYTYTDPLIVSRTVEHDLPELRKQVMRLLDKLD